MSFTPKIRDYLSEKLGPDMVQGFELWALVGMKGYKKPPSESFIDSWNFAHPRDRIRGSMNAFDAVDRMIEIWKERFDLVPVEE